MMMSARKRRQRPRISPSLAFVFSLCQAVVADGEDSVVGSANGGAGGVAEASLGVFEVTEVGGNMVD